MQSTQVLQLHAVGLKASTLQIQVHRKTRKHAGRKYFKDNLSMSLYARSIKHVHNAMLTKILPSICKNSSCANNTIIHCTPMWKYAFTFSRRLWFTAAACKS